MTTESSPKVDLDVRRVRFRARAFHAVLQGPRHRAAAVGARDRPRRRLRLPIHPARGDVGLRRYRDRSRPKVARGAPLARGRYGHHRIVRGDLLRFDEHGRLPVELVVCMVDTLVHLERKADVSAVRESRYRARAGATHPFVPRSVARSDRPRPIHSCSQRRLDGVHGFSNTSSRPSRCTTSCIRNRPTGAGLS